MLTRDSLRGKNVDAGFFGIRINRERITDNV
jgi:hypothetical protein